MLPPRQMEAAILLVITFIEVPASPITSSHGYSSSSKASRTSPTRTTLLGFVLFGFFNHLPVRCFYYVYVLKSEIEGNNYIGYTNYFKKKE